MTLSAGQRLGPYEILSPLGAGGMGEVYRARDTRLSREVACVHALRGEKDEAFRWLERAVEAGWRGWPIGTRSPLLDSLRSDPRLGRIEARVEGLVAEMRRRAGLR